MWICRTSGDALRIDIRHARHHLGRPDGNQQPVRPGIAFEEYVGAAHVPQGRHSRNE
jgi:hypothetical protein